jgi:hypothetical protein
MLAKTGMIMPLAIEIARPSPRAHFSGDARCRSEPIKKKKGLHASSGRRTMCLRCAALFPDAPGAGCPIGWQQRRRPRRHTPASITSAPSTSGFNFRN